MLHQTRQSIAGNFETQGYVNLMKWKYSSIPHNHKMVTENFSNFKFELFAVNYDLAKQEREMTEIGSFLGEEGRIDRQS